MICRRRSTLFFVSVACLLCSFGWSNAALATWNSTIAASNPLNWYRLNELGGATAIDYGSEGLDGTYGVGALAPDRAAVGPLGVGVTLDGDMDTIYLSGGNLTGDWTAEFVVQKNVASGRSSILIRGAPFTFPTTALKLEQHEASEQAGYTQFGQVDYVFTPAVITPLAEFIHLVYVKDATAVKAYVNGEHIGTRFDPIALSRYQLGDESGESPYAILDDVVIYDRVLSDEEIVEHFNAIPEPSAALLAVLAALTVIAFIRRRHAK